MPASRSRTERWRECLQQVLDRQGALEITFASPKSGGQASASPGHPEHGANLVWRVKLLALSDHEILVETPCAMGQPVRLGEHIDLVAIMSIGQNRWMFHTRTLGYSKPGSGGSGRDGGLRLVMPEAVERCQRRNFYRISTASVTLPSVDCWPLLDPTTVVAAEVANRAQILEIERSMELGQPRPFSTEPAVLPEVGPQFKAHLMNISGGGLGLCINRSDSGAIERPRLFWLRLNLTPLIPAPLGLTARLAHTHIDSTQNLYAGLAFDFAFHPGHREFVIDQVCRYVALLQREQGRSSSAA